MKLNTRFFAKPRSWRATQVVALGTFALAVQVACSDEPPAAPTFPPGAGGSSAGTSSTAGTANATAGSFSSTAGAFGTAGTPAAGGTGGAGTAGAGTGGTTAGTDTGGTAGTAGTGIVPVDPYCTGKPVEPLPFTVNSAYYPSGWSEGPPPAGQISNPTDLAVNACLDRVAGAVGQCTAWRYSPHAGAATPVWVIWASPPEAPNSTKCLADGATAIAFCARGVKGAEKIQTGGAGVTESEITLETTWKAFTVPLTGVTYNTIEKGVPTGFVWKVVPADPATATITEFFIDKIQIVKDAPGTDYCAPGTGGGEGGAGGAP